MPLSAAPRFPTAIKIAPIVPEALPRLPTIRDDLSAVSERRR